MTTAISGSDSDLNGDGRRDVAVERSDAPSFILFTPGLEIASRSPTGRRTIVKHYRLPFCPVEPAGKCCEGRSSVGSTKHAFV
jgi:hypothetical protein